MPSPPSAAVLVLNHNGRQHLQHCLPSLAALDYPAYSVTVIDNGSQDGSFEYVRGTHPEAKWLPLGRNHGFATAYNMAVRDEQAEVVALLNNDTRVDRGWLTALLAALDRHQAAAAAARILDWDGRHVDFAGALPTFVGHAWQTDHGKPVGREYDERPLLFGCAGSLAVRRDAFLAAGGFDEDYFAYFEDLDLGWRMSLMGLRTVFAPAAITYHRLHGTASRWPVVQRLRLYERNALFTIYKNYGDDALGRVLPAAVVLTLARALASAGMDPGAVAFGREAPASVEVPSEVVATLLALEDFARALPTLARKRSAVQRSRTVPDGELFALFPEPLKLHTIGPEYEEAARVLIRDFGIAELFGLAPDRETAHAGSSPARQQAGDAPGRPEVVRAGRIATAEERPLVSIVVLTASGPRHLPDCLVSLRSHDWPLDRTEVILVDNGSNEDPAPLAEQAYPGVRVIRNGANLGFAAGNNIGAGAASGEWLVFLNDDTRVDPGWIREMVGVATRRRAASVGAFLTDWSGERIDFAGGLVNVEGRGYSLDYDARLGAADDRERAILFGCGAAVMIRRDVFFGCGGWDGPTFAYYEDVELGWRLWMLGHEVWFAPRARVYHRHHGTAADSPARARAFERNALRMLYSLLEDDTLGRALPAALLLSADRLLLGTPFSRASAGSSAEGVHSAGTRVGAGQLAERLKQALRRRGARRRDSLLANLGRVGLTGLAAAARETLVGLPRVAAASTLRASYLIEETEGTTAAGRAVESLPAESVAQLLGVHDFIRMLPELSARRRQLQARRQRTDREILERFGDYWLNAVPSPRPDLHVALRDPLLAALGISGPDGGASPHRSP